MANKWHEITKAFITFRLCVFCWITSLGFSLFNFYLFCTIYYVYYFCVMIIAIIKVISRKWCIELSSLTRTTTCNLFNLTTNMVWFHFKLDSLCKDDASVDCARLNSMFSICKLTTEARKICPRYCNLCNMGT